METAFERSTPSNVADSALFRTVAVSLGLIMSFHLLAFCINYSHYALIIHLMA